MLYIYTVGFRYPCVCLLAGTLRYCLFPTGMISTGVETGSQCSMVISRQWFWMDFRLSGCWSPDIYRPLKTHVLLQSFCKQSPKWVHWLMMCDYLKPSTSFRDPLHLRALVPLQEYLFRKFVLTWKLCEMEKHLRRREVSCKPLTKIVAYWEKKCFPM